MNNSRVPAKLAVVGVVTAAFLLPAQGAAAKFTSSHCSAGYRVAKTSVYVKSCISLGSIDKYTVYMKNAGSKKAYINSEASYFQFSKDNKSWHAARAAGASTNGGASHSSGYFVWFGSGGDFHRTSSDRYARVVWRITMHTGSSTGSPSGSIRFDSAYRYR